MAREGIPINQFVITRYAHPQIQKIVEAWRVEPQHIIDKLIEYFRDMGLYEVHYGHETIVVQTMLSQLKNSPEIQRLVLRARHEEQKRQRSRHAE